MNTKNANGQNFPNNGVISSRGVGFEFPRGKGIDVQNRDRNKPKKAQPEEKHFERESHFSDAKNKLLIPEWRDNQLMQNTFLQVPGENCQTPTGLKYIDVDVDWQKKFKLKPNRHVTDKLMEETLSDMVEESRQNGEPTCLATSILHDIQPLTRIHEGSYGLYKDIIKFAGDEEIIKVDDVRKLGPLKYRAYQIAMEKTDLAFKPNKLPKPFGEPTSSPTNWTKDWDTKASKVSAGYSYGNESREKVTRSIKKEANTLYQRWTTEVINGDDLRNPVCIARIGRARLAHPTDLSTPLELIPDAHHQMVSECLFRPYYDAVLNDPNHPMYFNEDGTAEFLQELISHGEGVDLDGGKNETIQVATVAFKEFDTTVNGWLVKEQFKSLKNYFRVNTIEEQKTLDNFVDNLANMHVNCTVVMPDGRKFRKSRGLINGAKEYKYLQYRLTYFYIQFGLAMQHLMTPAVQRPPLLHAMIVKGNESMFLGVNIDFSKILPILERTFHLHIDRSEYPRGQKTALFENYHENMEHLNFVGYQCFGGTFERDITIDIKRLMFPVDTYGTFEDGKPEPVLSATDKFKYSQIKQCHDNWRPTHTVRNDKVIELKEKYDMYDLYDVKYTKNKLLETIKQIEQQRIRTKKLFGGENCYDENPNLQVNQEFINNVWQKFSEKYLNDEE